jgi:hypothetical protein
MAVALGKDATLQCRSQLSVCLSVNQKNFLGRLSAHSEKLSWSSVCLTDLQLLKMVTPEGGNRRLHLVRRQIQLAQHRRRQL